MRKRICAALLLAAVALYAATCVLTIRQQQDLAEKMIRLHVVAASDSETDQSNKLQVRDCVLRAASELMDGAGTAAEAAATLTPHLTALAQAAESRLEQLGAPADVTVTLGQEALDTREYDTFTLPAGTYTTLRVVIGAGEGHNWWCVVFPTLCTAASADAFGQSALEAGLTEGEVQWITSDTADIRIRFKTLEWLQRLFDLLR